MSNYSVDLNNFVNTVVRRRDSLPIIRQLANLINEKYITPVPVASKSKAVAKSGAYPDPYLEQLKDTIKMMFWRQYDEDQIAIITQNLTDLYYLLWNQNLSGWQIYAILTAILQGEPVEVLQGVILRNRDEIYDNLNYYPGVEAKLDRMMDVSSKYVDLTLDLLLPQRVLNNHLALKLGPEVRSTLGGVTDPSLANRRPLEWELLARGWPLEVIEDYYIAY